MDWKERLKGLLSRKFFVWAVATVLVFTKDLDPQYWFYISLAYVGVNGVQKFVDAMKEKKNGS